MERPSVRFYPSRVSAGGRTAPLSPSQAVRLVEEAGQREAPGEVRRYASAPPAQRVVLPPGPRHLAPRHRSWWSRLWRRRR